MEGFEDGEAEDGVHGDVITKGDGDGDVGSFVVDVGGRVADDSGKEAMSGGVEIFGV